MTALHHLTHSPDVCIIGGGMAGLCAAIASARHGAKTLLLHDRSVLGGNASSEVRMWICGAHGKHNKETGILEEIQLENLYRNPSLNYSVWDSVLYGKAKFQPNLTLLLDTSCTAANMTGNRIASVQAWQSPAQTIHTVTAKTFIDCSGDSILAPLTGALTRHGREARNEFDEDIEPTSADAKTMGNSLLIQLRKTDTPHPFIPPTWAYKFLTPEDVQHRIRGVQTANFWWIELGGLLDTIKDHDKIRDDLHRTVYGILDYLKNRAPEKDQTANWAVEWIGSLPGKRESRRYVGYHTLTQNDIRNVSLFPDTIAYGGWSMDDHHPAGLLYPGKPTIFHPAPSPYPIPFRCLFSKNIDNLLFAGRNISVTHAALSSTRVMATCALLGQAAGTATALCTRHACTPQQLHSSHLAQLQSALMDDDAWLPDIPRPISSLAKSATLSTPQDSGFNAQDFSVLLDGLDRDREDAPHHLALPLDTPIDFHWPTAQKIAGLRLILDSNLNNDKRMPCTYPQYSDKPRVPPTLLKSFRIESQNPDGSFTTLHEETNNYQRLVRIPLAATTQCLRFTPLSTWGDPQARIFSLEPFTDFQTKIPAPTHGPLFHSLAESLNPADLAPPENGLESPAAKQSHSA